MADTFSPLERSRIMAAVKSKGTTPEMVVRRLVHGMGYRYRLHDASLPGTPDLVFPRLRKVIIVNGCFWHMHTCGRCRIPASRRRYCTRSWNEMRLVIGERGELCAMRAGGCWWCGSVSLFAHSASGYKHGWAIFLTLPDKVLALSGRRKCR